MMIHAHGMMMHGRSRMVDQGSSGHSMSSIMWYDDALEQHDHDTLTQNDPVVCSMMLGYASPHGY